MNFIKNLLKPGSATVKSVSLPFTTDLHSHLIPNIDDGSQSMEETIGLIIGYKELGYTKLITTPHVITDHFPNTPASISAGLDEVKKELADKKIEMQFEASAEYYIDEFFLKRIEAEGLLPFGNKYILIETSTVNYPMIFRDVIFELKLNGFNPVLAHPERYTFLWNNNQLLHELRDTELLFQLNCISLTGGYSPGIKKMAEKLIDERMVDFAGSDVHEISHLDYLARSLELPYAEKLFKLNLLNNTL
jgi:tyrosine-protein phosphatase YwqE